MAKLYFRYGCVGSAKTLNLVAVAHTYQSQNKSVLIAKPRLDIRFNQEDVTSRSGLTKQATHLLDDETYLTLELCKDVHCVLVDEVQFLNPRHIEVFRQIADAGCPVICYGLRTDFRSHVFPGSKRLLEIADSIEEVKTTCAMCNKKAVLNIKCINDVATLQGESVQLGFEETYLPTCSPHYYLLLKDAGYDISTSPMSTAEQIDSIKPTPIHDISIENVLNTSINNSRGSIFGDDDDE